MARKFVNRKYHKATRMFFLLFLCVFFLGVGFANIASNLGINGNVSLSSYKPIVPITLQYDIATTLGTQTIYEKFNDGYYLENELQNKMTTSTNPITIPTYTGYNFGGYYTEPNGGGVQYIDSNGYITSNADKTHFTSDGTLYIKWTGVQTTVTLDQQSGSGGTASVTAIYGSAMPTATAPTRTNYYFGGYWTGTGGTGTQYYNASMQSVRAWDITDSTKTLYAYWDPCGYFTNDSWSTIVSNVKSGNYNRYPVGCTKDVELGNSLGTHPLRVANNSNYNCSLASKTACGFVLEFADIITTHVMNSTDTNVGGWPASEMRTYVNGTIYNALPSVIKDAIINTTVVSGHGKTSGETNFTSTDKLYLLSTKEVYGKEGTSNVIDYDTAETETRQLDYYQAQGVTTSYPNYIGALKERNGSTDLWWLRSASSPHAGNFFYVYYYGNWNSNHAIATNGVSPAFRIA